MAHFRTSTEYKMKKADMQVYVSENATLELTQEILERQNSALAAQLGDLEDKKGISGYTKTQETLEEVSAAKADADAAKGLTVEEHAAKTQQLTENVNAKKSSLAPLIQELRSARADAQTIEVNCKALGTPFTRNPRLNLTRVGPGTASLTNTLYPPPPVHPGARYAHALVLSLRPPSLPRRQREEGRVRQLRHSFLGRFDRISQL